MLVFYCYLSALLLFFAAMPVVGASVLLAGTFCLGCELFTSDDGEEQTSPA